MKNMCYIKHKQGDVGSPTGRVVKSTGFLPVIIPAYGRPLVIGGKMGFFDIRSELVEGVNVIMAVGGWIYV